MSASSYTSASSSSTAFSLIPIYAKCIAALQTTTNHNFKHTNDKTLSLLPVTREVDVTANIDSSRLFCASLCNAQIRCCLYEVVHLTTPYASFKSTSSCFLHKRPQYLILLFYLTYPIYPYSYIN